MGVRERERERVGEGEEVRVREEGRKELVKTKEERWLVQRFTFKTFKS